jgi:hypothetical protein
LNWKCLILLSHEWVSLFFISMDYCKPAKDCAAVTFCAESNGQQDSPLSGIGAWKNQKVTEVDDRAPTFIMRNTIPSL